MMFTREINLRAAALALLALATAAPATAQLGGLRKKVRTANARTPAADQGGTLVLDNDVIERLIAGLRAGKAEKEAATKEDTPYGRYVRAKAAYAQAKSKCEAAGHTWHQRMAADQRLMDRNNALLEKMMAAMEKQDTAVQRAYGDSLLAMQDPSCAVKEPAQPTGHYDDLQQVEARAEQAELEAAGFDRQELALVKERVLAVLEGSPPTDMSTSEHAAVQKRADELNRLMDRAPPPAAATSNPAPAPAAAAPPPQPVVPAASAGQEAAADCMMRNAQKHEEEFRRLAEAVRVAQERGDMQAVMAMADTIRLLQTAGCPGS